MPTFLETIKLVVETSTGKAASDLKTLGTTVREAEGPFGKLKAAAGGAGDFISKNLGLSIATAVTAVTAFGIKMIATANDLALSAGKFADATGLNVEQASRWIEVAGDIGIETGTLQSAFSKLAKAIGSNPEKFAELGVSIRRAKDGTIDMNGTILSAIDVLNRTPDATDRAAKGAALFGKGWTDLAELIGEGSGKITADLAKVSNEKVIDEGELARAKSFRDSMDRISDAGQALAINLGQTVAPTVEKLVLLLASVAEKVGDSDNSVLEFGKNLLLWTPGVDALNQLLGNTDDAAKGASDGIELVGGSSALAAEKQQELADAADAAAKAQADAEKIAKIYADRLNEQAAAAQTVADALKSMPDIIDDQQEAFTDLGKAIDDFNKKPTAENLSKVEKASAKLAEADTKLAEATAKSTGSLFNELSALDQTNLSYLKQAATLRGPAKQAILDRIAQLNGIPPEKITEIRALLDQGKIAEANAALQNTSKTREAQITADANTAKAEAELNKAARDRSATINAYVDFRDRATGARVPGRNLGFAQGGPVRFAGGGVVLVGERGPELVGLPEGSQVMPAERLARIAREEIRNTFNFHIPRRMTAAEEERAVVKALRGHQRRNGSLF